jgi:hypothetical protein
MLSVTVASSRLVYMGTIRPFVPRQAMIESLVETGKDESASQHAE